MIYRDRQVLCLFARDISEEKEAERESQRLRRQLFFSQKHEAVGRLAAGIAHDFNNHLTVMLLCAQVIGDRPSPGDENQEELTELTTAGRRAGGLVRQLLAFSGRQLLLPQLVKFDATLMHLEKMVRRVVGEDIEVVTEYDTGSSTINADPTQLEQVVLNLVVNARDAMPDGGKLELTTTEVDLGEDFVRDYVTLSPGPHVMLKVTDTGHGIAEDTLQHVFEPFFTTKKQGEGTGLGLATVYGIVKQSGGSIWASSELGSGSTFRVYFPVVDPDREETEHVEVDDSEDPVGGTETILLVEDEEMVRVLTSRILRNLGYSVLEADGAEEALRALRTASESSITHVMSVTYTFSDFARPPISSTVLNRLSRALRGRDRMAIACAPSFPPPQRLSERRSQVPRRRQSAATRGDSARSAAAAGREEALGDR